MISLIVAMDRNRVIGNNGRLPWHLPDDMDWFRRQTMGKPVIMGRKTFESIPAKFRPLPGRTNIVLTRNPDYLAEGTEVVHSVEAALAAGKPAEEIMIAGGAELFRLLLPQANRVYLTLIDAQFEGDSRFPTFDPSQWREIFRQKHAIDGRHPYRFIWFILENPAAD